MSGCGGCEREDPVSSEDQIERLAKWIAGIVSAEMAPGAATSRAEAEAEVQKLKTDTRAQCIPEVHRQHTETKPRAKEAQRRKRPTRPIRTFKGHSDDVISVAFSPDGRTALSGSADILGGGDNTLKLWEAATGKELRTFTGHSDRVVSVTFSPDGRSALSGCADNTLRLWDLTGP